MSGCRRRDEAPLLISTLKETIHERRDGTLVGGGWTFPPFSSSGLEGLLFRLFKVGGLGWVGLGCDPSVQGKHTESCLPVVGSKAKFKYIFLKFLYRLGYNRVVVVLIINHN